MLGAFRACPAPRVGAAVAGRVPCGSRGRSPPRGFALGRRLWSRQARPLPWLRAGGGYLVPLFAVQSRHEEPYPPMSKINIPFTVPFTGNTKKYTPFPRCFQAGNAVFGNCAKRLARRARPTRCGSRGDAAGIRTLPFGLAFNPEVLICPAKKVSHRHGRFHCRPVAAA